MGQSKQAVLTQIYAILTSDTTLKALFDDLTVLLYPKWGSPNSKTPYINHRIEGSDIRYGEFDGSYIVDIFDTSPLSDTVDSIAFRIECLLNQVGFAVTDTKGVNLYLHGQGDVPETEQNHQHYHMEFRVVFFKKAEITAINTR